MGLLGRSALAACFGLLVVVAGQACDTSSGCSGDEVFAEDDIEGMTAYLYDEAVYAPASTDCSSGSPEENELCE